MIYQEHLDILKQGVEVWNQWRKEHPDIQPDLRRVNLSSARLSGADLSHANLGFADLHSVDLRDAGLYSANLSGTDLYSANLSFANLGSAHLGSAHLNDVSLISADLWRARLISADLSRADLRLANLSGADLRCANLSDANLSDADFSHARISGTVFGSVNLSVAKGLDTIRHDGPSTIGIDTLIRSHGNIPEIFLRNAGVPVPIIEAIPSLVGSLKPTDFYSCFISYSSKDQHFAERLYADLKAKGVLCWFAPEDLKWGEHIQPGIDKAIHFHDKLLLILSKHSVASGWVEHEVKTALARERKEKRTVLFPVRVDTAVFDSPLSWATEIHHERNIGDFTRWKKNHDEYQKAFTRLLRDLKAEA